MKEAILQLNEAIRAASDELDIYLIDPHELFADDDGLLKPEYDFGDGAHLNLDGYRALGEFVRDSMINGLVPGTVVGCLGDSLTEGYPFSLRVGARGGPGSEFKAYPDFLRLEGVTVVNMGIAGDTTDGILRRARTIVPGSMDLCLVMGGTNDIAIGYQLDQVLENLVKTYVSLEEDGEIEPVALTIIPTRIIGMPLFNV